MTTKTDTSGEFRGYDAEGHRVVVGWVNADGSEYLIGLTKCCQASAKGTSHGIACRACYEPCDQGLGAEATVAGQRLEVVGEGRIDDWGFPLTRTVA